MPRAIGATQLIRASYPLAWTSSARTVLVVMKKASDTGGTSAFVLGADGSAVTKWRLELSAANLVRLVSTGLAPAATMTATVADGWVCLGFTKVAGNAAPRFHKYVYSTGAASHEDATGTSGADVTGTAGSLVWGRASVGGTTGWFGSLAATAHYLHVLSDVEFEAAAQSVAAMSALSPTGLWLFDYESGTNELTLGSIAVTDTSTVDTGGSPLSYGHPIF